MMKPVVPVLAYFCPKCANASLKRSEISGPDGAAECISCNWKGKNQETLVLPVDKAPGADMVKDSRLDFIRSVGGQFQEKFLLWLLKWGFIDSKDKEYQADATLYIKNATLSAYQSILDTRRQIVENRKRGKA